MPEPEENVQQIHTSITNLPVALAELTTRSNWVLWRWETVNSNRTKVPYQPNGMKASTTDRSTWSSYVAVTAACERASHGKAFSGIGFCLDEDISAFDIDNCRDLETGMLHPWAANLIARAQSYTEITISGTGIRIIGLGLGPKIHKKQRVDAQVTCESYRKPAGRYIVVTGAQIESYVLANIDQVMDEVVAELTAANSGNGQGDGAAGGGGAFVDELDRTILDGGSDRHGGSRSEAVWWVVCEMLRRGYAPDTITKTLLDPAGMISEHCLAQANSHRAARRAVSRGLALLEFSVDRNGKKYVNNSNIRIAMAKMNIALRFNEFSNSLMIESPKIKKMRNLKDNDVIVFKDDVEEYFAIKAPKDMLYDIFEASGTRNAFHPVVDYLDALTWDGTARVDKWLTTYLQSPDTEYVRAVGKLMLVAAVRRIRDPGCKFDEIVIFEGIQGTKRSELLQILAVKQEWFLDDLPLSSRGKEILEMTQGKWIVELSELSGMKRTDVEHIKAFTSRQVDRARMAYGRIVMEVLRQYILAGTTNAHGYLRDLTGNRRFWPVDIGVIDIEAVRRDRDQLWAEASTLEKTGMSIRLDERLWGDAEEQQQMRVSIDPYFETIESHLGGFAKGRIAAVDVWALLNIQAGHRTQDQNQRLGLAMKNNGWKKIKIRDKHDTPVNGYTKGNAPQPLIDVTRNDNGSVTAGYAPPASSASSAPPAPPAPPEPNDEF